MASNPILILTLAQRHSQVHRTHRESKSLLERSVPAQNPDQKKGEMDSVQYSTCEQSAVYTISS